MIKKPSPDLVSEDGFFYDGVDYSVTVTTIFTVLLFILAVRVDLPAALAVMVPYSSANAFDDALLVQITFWETSGWEME